MLLEYCDIPEESRKSDHKVYLRCIPLVIKVMLLKISCYDLVLIDVKLIISSSLLGD